MKTSHLLIFALFAVASVAAANGEANMLGAFELVCNALALPCASKKESFPPSKELVVVGAGFGKTGTKSLKEALQILGFRSYHMDEMQPSGHQKMMTDAYAIGTPEVINEWLDDILRLGFNATVDFPTASFYYEQLQRFPKAKVILTTRDPEGWFKSLSNMFSVIIKGEGIPLESMHMFSLFDKGLGSNKTKYALGTSGCYKLSTTVPTYTPWFAPWVKYPITHSLDKEKCIKEFNRHNAEVRKLVPKQQLLEFKVSDGWKPLCDFLGVAIPNEPFPSVNSKDEWTYVNRLFLFLCYAYPLFVIIPVGAVLGICIYLKRIFGSVSIESGKPKTA